MTNVFLFEGRFTSLVNHCGYAFKARPDFPLSVPVSKSDGICSSPIRQFAQLLVTSMQISFCPSFNKSVMSFFYGGYHLTPASLPFITTFAMSSISPNESMICSAFKSFEVRRICFLYTAVPEKYMIRLSV